MLKKGLLSLVFAGLFTVNVFAADGDITEAEVKPDVAKWVIKSVAFHVPIATCKVVYNKVDAGGNVIERAPAVFFRNIADDPETPESEELTEFTDLVVFINNNSNIKQSIATAVKIKLGL